MVRAAVADQPGLVVDDREIRRAGPSWTVLTLRELRAEAPTRPLCLILGMDAFLGLPQWHEWHAVLELAHVVVAHRPGWMARQTSRALNALGRGMIILSQRLASDCDGQPVTRFKETGG